MSTTFLEPVLLFRPAGGVYAIFKLKVEPAVAAVPRQWIKRRSVTCSKNLDRPGVAGGFSARPLRLEFEDAMYHVMARGNARQKIFLEHEDYRKLSDGLAR